MKQVRSALLSRTEGFVSQIRNPHTPILLGGAPISKVNREIFARCLECWLILIEDLMVSLDIPLEGREARSKNFFESMLPCDPVEVIAFLDELYLSLIGDKFDSYNAFKQYCESHSPRCCDYRRLLSPINQAVKVFLEYPDKIAIEHSLPLISQFLRYPRKLEFQAIGLEDRALLEYLETEGNLGAVADYDSECLDGIESIIHNWFEDFHIENLRPNHGSGSVAEGPLTLAEKFHQMKTDATLQVLLRNHCDPDSYLGYFPIRPGTDLDRTSRTIFVPKTATKLRTISMEPATLQYIQQGVMKELYRYIEKHPYLGIRIRLSDQSQNQILAQDGSMRHNYGTIDLSKASDTVTWDLVRRIFRSTPKLYRWLLGTRSRFTILPNGERLQLKKFAPMGSALCFPIECIIFSAIVEYASRKVCRRLRIPHEIWSVYGDDLVVQTEAYDETVKCLKSCGFIVNDDKSYNGGSYRESCGKEYYAGVDISPLYYRIPFYNKKVSPSAFGSWCSSANNAFLHRLPLYRWYLLKKILSVSVRMKPYFTQSPEVSPFLYSPQPTNFESKIRWNKRYQRDEGRFIVVKSRPRDGELEDDSLRYFVRLVEMSWRPSGPQPISDEPPSPNAMHGSVEYFSSTILPVPARLQRDLKTAVDWWDTVDL